MKNGFHSVPCILLKWSIFFIQTFNVRKGNDSVGAFPIYVKVEYKKLILIYDPAELET